MARVAAFPRDGSAGSAEFHPELGITLPEVEIKLAARPQDLPKLKQALLTISAKGEERNASLHSTYFDTPELELLRQEMVLRVRRDGPDFIQTVKTGRANGGADLLSREEWEDRVTAEAVDLGAPNTGPQLAFVAGTELRPLFATNVSRIVIMLEPNAATSIEAAIDTGEIRALGGSAADPVSEIELELKRGETAALYDVALRLLDVAPLRFSLITKAERGYRLANGGGAPEPRFARDVTISPEMTVEAVLQTIGRHSIAHILGNEPAVLAQVPEGNHQMRVALRRLRSMLGTLRPVLPPEHYNWANGELKWLADSLGNARNWDVFMLTLLKPVAEALPRDEELKRLAEACARRRQEEYEKAREAVLSPRFTATILRLARWFETRAWRDQPVSEDSARLVGPITAVATELIEERMRKFLKRSRHFGRLDEVERHELRIACKKLRYTIEFLGSLYDPEKVEMFLKRLKPIQEDLGNANDVAVAHGLLETLKAPQLRRSIDRAGGLVLGWHQRGLADRELKLKKHLAGLRRAEPFW